MDVAPASAAERRARLAELVTRDGFVRVVDAARLLGVSEVTVRADLSALEDEGGVLRIHGGAMPAREERSVELTLASDADAKRAIAAEAATLVESGQSVILDVGSTTLALADALVRRSDLTDLSIITNGITVALALERAGDRFSVVVTGGVLRPLQHSLVNPGVTSFLESVHADVAFIGCNGVSALAGVTNVNYPEAEVKRRMLRSAKRGIRLADSSKLGRASLGVVGPVTDFELLVTDGGQPEQVEALRAAGLRVVTALAARG